MASFFMKYAYICEVAHISNAIISYITDVKGEIMAGVKGEVMWREPRTPLI